MPIVFQTGSNGCSLNKKKFWGQETLGMQLTRFPSWKPTVYNKDYTCLSNNLYSIFQTLDHRTFCDRRPIDPVEPPLGYRAWGREFHQRAIVRRNTRFHQHFRKLALAWRRKWSWRESVISIRKVVRHLVTHVFSRCVSRRTPLSTVLTFFMLTCEPPWAPLRRLARCWCWVICS